MGDNNSKKSKKYPPCAEVGNITLVLDFIFEKCSNRIAKKLRNENVKQIDVLPKNPKLVSKIVNNKIEKNNRYLICDSIFYNTNEDGKVAGLLAKTSFKSMQEVLWGDKTEIYTYAKELFFLIIEAIASPFNSSKNDIFNTVSEILCDYVPYAKTFTYFQILEKEEKYSALLYGVYEDEIFSNIENDFVTACDILFCKCQKQYIDEFVSFTDNTKTFKKIDKQLENFIINKLLPILTKYRPNEFSLGIRVRNLIKSDLSLVPMLCEENENLEKNEYYKALINASSQYICKLEKIQQNDYKRKIQVKQKTAVH